MHINRRTARRITRPPSHPRRGMHANLTALVLAWLANITLANATEAAQVFKCRQADGHVAYSQQACDEDGSAATRLRVQDHRTSEQAKQARTMHKRNDALARSLGRERRRSEKRNQAQEAVDLTGWPSPTARSARDADARKQAKAASRKAPASSRRKDRSADPHAPKPLRPADFTAQVPGVKGQRTRKPADAKATSSSDN